MKHAPLLGLVVVFAFFIHAQTPISTPPLGPTPDGVESLHIVPQGDRFLAIWLEGDYKAREIRGRYLSPDGTPQGDGSFVIVAQQTGLGVFNVASDGASVYVLWLPVNTPQTDFRLSRVDADGAVTLLASTLQVPWGVVIAMACSADGVTIVAADPARYLTATRVDRNGTLLQHGVRIAQTGYSVQALDVSITGGTLAYSWIAEDGRVRTGRTPLAAVTAENVDIPLYVRNDGGLATSVRMASSETGAMAVWYEHSPSENLVEVRERSLTGNGNPITPAPVVLTTLLAAGPPSIVPTAEGYEIFLVESVPVPPYAYTSRPVSIRVGVDGSLRSLSRGAVSPTLANGGEGAIACNQDRSVAIWTENRWLLQNGSGRQVVAAAIAPNGDPGNPAIVSIDQPVQHVRKLLPIRNGVAALWTEAAPNQRVVAGRFTTAGQPLDGAGLRLRDSIYEQRNSAVATNGSSLYVAWIERQDSQWTVYGAVVSMDGPLTANVRQLVTGASVTSDLAVAWNGATFTVVYQRAGTLDLAALRVDAANGVVDPQPIVLTPPRPAGFYGDLSPQLSWNGSEYLLAWQREVHWTPQVPFEPPTAYLYQLFAQRFSSALAADGPEIPLSTFALDQTPSSDAERPDLALSGGVWLVSWFDFGTPFGGVPIHVRYARVDAGGVRLDPLNGRPLGDSIDLWMFAIAPKLAAAPDGWLLAYGTPDLLLTHISADGAPDSRGLVAGIQSFEALLAAPQPLVAYTQPYDRQAYLTLFLQHRRATAR